MKKVRQKYSPPWSLSVRLAPPAYAADVLKRERLGGWLFHNSDARIIMLRAPAGYGKTTLLRQWRETLLEKGELVAWLTADQIDNKNVQLLRSIALSFDKCGVAMDGLGLLSSFDPRILDVSNVVPALLDRIAATNAAVTLMVDDLEVVTDASSADLLQSILQRFPSNLRVIISGRKLPELGISKLRATGRLAELGSPELRFDEEETRALLGSDLARESFATLNERFAGWPVALGFLKLSTENREMEALSANDRVPSLDDYVKQEVLSVFSADQRKCLRSLSILDDIDIDLADSIRGASDSSALLASAATNSPLVVAERGAEPHYRVHSVLRDCLYRQTYLASPEAVRANHAAAARWFAKSGNVDAAIRHGVRSGDVSLFASVLSECGGLSICFEHGTALLEKALSHFLNSALETEPLLQLLQSYLLLKSGDPSSARVVFSLAKRSADRKELRDFDLERDFALVEAFFSFEEGPIDPAIGDRLIEQSAVEQRPLSRTLQLAGRMCQSYAAFQAGRMREAMTRAEQAEQLCLDLHWPLSKLYAILQEAMVDVALGKLENAATKCAELRECIAAGCPTDYGIIPFTDIIRSQIAWINGETGQSIQMLPCETNQLATADWWFDIRAVFHPLQALLIREQDGADQAIASLEAARLWCRDGKFQELERITVAMTINIRCWEGAYDEAADISRAAAAAYGDIDTWIASACCWQSREAVVYSLARSLIGCADAERGLDIVQRTAECAETEGRVVSFIEGAILTAAACLSNNRKDDAAVWWTKAISAMRDTSVIRPLLLERRIAFNALDALKLQDDAASWLRQTIKSNDTRESRTNTFGLSNRELEVLQGLGRGVSNKHLAREFDITEATVKFHVRNIFDKLGVRKRSDAVLMAREHALIK